MSSFKQSRFERRKARAGYVFILPWILGFLLFFLVPIVFSIILAFHNAKMSPQGLSLGEPVGWRNFIDALTRDPYFPQSMVAAVRQMISNVAVITIFSMVIAVLLKNAFTGRTVYRAIFFLPVIISSGPIMSMLQGTVVGGTNTYMLQSSGIGEVLNQSELTAFLAPIVTQMVNNVFNVTLLSGVQILLLLAALHKIPDETYEASKIEGANAWDNFWKITMPLISPMLLLNIIYTIIDSFTAYGTSSTGNTVLARINEIGFGKNLHFSLSAAMSWIYFTLIIIIIFVVYVTLGRYANRIER